MDHEIPDGQAAEVERHFAICAQCQASVEAYRKVGAEFDAYCETATTAKVRRRMPHRAPVLSRVAAAAVAVLFLFFPHTQLKPPSLRPNASRAAMAPSVVAVGATLPARIKKIHRWRAIAPANIQQTNWVPSAPAIEIAFPAEALFPPGAVPQGFGFVADVSISADGSAQQLRLRP